MTAPAHFRNMDQAFDALFELDEDAVIGDAHHAALDAGIDREFRLDIHPRVGADLLEAEGNAFFLLIELENHDLDLVANGEHLRGVIDAAPRHVGDVQQAVDPAEVDEHAVLGDVLDDSLDEVPFLHLLERTLAQLLALLLEQNAAGKDDVAALLVHLDDFHLEALADQPLQVAHRPEVDLRTGQKGLEADIDSEAALGLGHHDAFDGLVVLVSFDQFVPDLDLVRFFLGQDDVAVVVLHPLQVDFDLIADGQVLAALGELGLMDQSLGFEADVHGDEALADFDDPSVNNLPLLELFQALAEIGLHFIPCLLFLRRKFLLFF